MDDLLGKLALSALTLRGVGSYLHGARLDIRPLTILCGKNGSGKSTWFQVLDMLRAWSLDGDFPFQRIGRRGDARDVGGHDFTNAFVKDCVFRNPVLADREDDLEKYGPPGAIGLHFVATESFVLPPVHDLSTYIRSPGTTAQSFLWRGECRKDMHFRLRLALPTTPCPNDFHGLVWDELIELCIDDKYRIECRCDNPYAFDPEFEGIDHAYTLSCAEAFLPGRPEGCVDMMPVLRFERQHSLFEQRQHSGEEPWLGDVVGTRLTLQGLNARHAPAAQFETERDWDEYTFAENLPTQDHHFPEKFLVLHRTDEIPRELQTDLLHAAIVRIRQLFDMLMSGYFHIGAIRNIRETELPAVQKQERARPEVPSQRKRRTRHVGSQGQFALDVWSRFAYNQVRSSTAPFSGYIPQEFKDDQLHGGMMNRVVEMTNGSPSSEAARMQRMLRLVAEAANDDVVSATEESEDPTDLSSFQHDGPPSDEASGDQQLQNSNPSGSAISFADILNRLLRRRNLYRPSDWPEPDQLNPMQCRSDFDKCFRRYWKLHDEFERRETFEREANEAEDEIALQRIVDGTTVASDLAAHSHILHWAINAGFDRLGHEEDPYDDTVYGQIDGCDHLWRIPTKILQCDEMQDSADAILRLLWHLLDAPSPRAVAQFGDTASWRANLRALIDSPPEHEEARHLSNELSRMLRLLFDGPPPGREARFLIRQGVENLCEEDLLRLNRLLLEAVFCEPDSLLGRLPGYVVDTQITYWLKALLGVGRVPRVFPRLTVRQSLGDLWADRGKQRPTGSLVTPQPEDIPYFNPLLWKEPNQESGRPVNLVRSEREVFSHPCFGGERMNPVLPERLSAGFHQVAPMVVQTAVMRQNELLAVENPEVHLHPSLQLQVTEFLICQAQASKRIAVETHSDLVVRRVLRAILAEELPQSAVAIYFTDIEQAEQGYQYSRLRRLQVDEKGRIDNWPEGFLDDDVQESQRLLDIMYGGGNAEDDDE